MLIVALLLLVLVVSDRLLLVHDSNAFHLKCVIITALLVVCELLKLFLHKRHCATVLLNEISLCWWKMVHRLHWSVKQWWPSVIIVRRQGTVVVIMVKPLSFFIVSVQLLQVVLIRVFFIDGNSEVANLVDLNLIVTFVYMVLSHTTSATLSIVGDCILWVDKELVLLL